MSDEAVRKEFEAWLTDDKQRGLSAYLSYVIAQEAFSAGFASGRSAAIQECAEVVDSHQCRSEYVKTHLRDRVLALKER